MSHKARFWAGLLILCSVAFTPVPAAAQAFDTFEVVCTFHVSDAAPLGRLVQMPDGSLLGTTSAGGTYGGGAIFALRPDGMGGFDFEEMHSFSGPDGRLPFAGLTRASDGYLYGTTAYGGQYDYGTVFRADETGRITVLHSFPGFDVPEPRYPSGGLLFASDGYLYGAATGGAIGQGAIFRVSLAGEVSTLHDFNFSDGAGPNGDLVESSDGYFYGTTFDGPGAQSTIFRVNGAGDFASLHTLSFDEGNWIRGGLVEAGGLFYGTSSYGGTNSDGTVFTITAGGAFTKLHDFTGGADGGGPYPGLTAASDGNFYGVTYGGGANGAGVLFRVDGSGGAVTPTHGFDRSVDGANPQGPLMHLDGMLFGTTYNGGASSRTYGTVFSASLGGTVTVLHGFTSNDGYGPVGGLLAASDGSLYGTTRFGGVSGPGTLFRLGASDIPEFLASFASDIEGYHPDAALIESPDGTLLGTAQSGGTGQQGTVFQYTLAGSATTLASFSGPDGSQPSASPVRAGDGNVWGTTTDGGAFSHGILFRIDESGASDVHDFDLTDGAGPTSLVSGSDGSLYGIATYGGTLGVLGSAFKIDLSTASFTVLHLFGSVPDDPTVPSFLAAAPDGNLYGTSLNGGAYGDGAVFQLDNAGNVTTLHSFDSSVDGSGPGTIMQASTGDLYGTTPGEVFRLEPGGTLTNMHSFTGGPDGADPTSPLIEGPDGNLYGTTYQGGFVEAGVVYRLLPAPATPTVTSISPTSGSAAGGASVRVRGTHFQLSPGAAFGGIGSVAVLGADSRTVIALAPALTPGSVSDVTVTNVDATTATLPKAWFADFLDVDSLNLFHDDVEAIVRAGITAGCGNGNYCVSAFVTRAQMAVFLLKAKLGADHVPPPATGTVFLDVPLGSFAADWIEELASLGVTSGCGGGNYCPGASVTRAQMAVFLLKTSLGSGYVPPVVAQIFGDVAPGDFAADWINDLYGRGITGGCSMAPLLYCPANANTRGQMAVFLTKTFLQP